MLGSLRSNRHLWGSVLLSCVMIAAAGVWSAFETSAGLDVVQTGLGFEIDLTTVPPTMLVPVTDESMRQFRAEITAQEIAAAPLGSYVRITDDAGITFDGTLISRDADQMELMNCLSKEVVPGPRGIQQLKTSHVPLQSFSRASIAGFTAIFPPAPGYAAGDFPGTGARRRLERLSIGMGAGNAGDSRPRLPELAGIRPRTRARFGRRAR